MAVRRSADMATQDGARVNVSPELIVLPDLKNTRNGFSLQHYRSFSVARLNIALLISAVAMFALWLLGVVAKRADEHHSYQANSVRHRNVLSTFTIEWQGLKHKMRCRVAQLTDALAFVRMHASCGFVW